MSERYTEESLQPAFGVRYGWAALLVTDVLPLGPFRLPDNATAHPVPLLFPQVSSCDPRREVVDESYRHDRCMMERDDELGAYMRQGPVRRENLNPILWWKDHQEEYPRLSKFALDVLAVPAMSVDPERTFSVTKLTLSS
ncbi:hypothetical protein HIM_10956 [Hirsutella minnesotensis 3608]|uniref:HAT C-terminal dimerisation domain-containing protein n=1 Tax=Hirsutella minnesotensis 3608 TaxID=1043627 RepID=A0A0F7ZFS7_9HYPO|nr:hypothetical protein HIM_10956 [Hirsutella minnesotensis 3608]